MAVAFDGSGSDDPDGKVTGYAWDFGDGNTGTSQNPSHTYGRAGDFTVILTVTDDDSAMASDTTAASIDSDGANLPPTADPGGPYTGDEAAAVNFDGGASSDLDGSIAQYDWDFGDGNTAIDGGLTPSNTYAVSGNYDVTLTVTDDGGATDSQVAVAAIGVDNVPPTADAGGPYPGRQSGTLATVSRVADCFRPIPIPMPVPTRRI